MTSQQIKFSNRHLIDQMRKWGFEVNRVKGERTYMRLPAAYMRRGRTIAVASAHVRKSNGTATMNAILDALGIEYSTFWVGPPPTSTTAEPQTPAPRLPLVQIAPQPEPEPDNPKEESEMTSTKRDRGLSRRVLDELQASPRPLTTEELARRMNLTTRQISNAAVTLVKHGLVARPGRGVYVATRSDGPTTSYESDRRVSLGSSSASKGDGLPPDVADAGGTSTTPETGSPNAKPLVNGDLDEPDQPGPDSIVETATQQEIKQTTPSRKPSLDRDGEDETIIEVLDLLFPNGVRVRDLPLIDEWRRITRRLLLSAGVD